VVGSWRDASDDADLKDVESDPVLLEDTGDRRAVLDSIRTSHAARQIPQKDRVSGTVT